MKNIIQRGAPRNEVRLIFAALLLGILVASAPALHAQGSIPPCAVTQKILYSTNVSTFCCNLSADLESDAFPFKITPGHFIVIIDSNFFQEAGSLGEIDTNTNALPYHVPVGSVVKNVDMAGNRLRVRAIEQAPYTNNSGPFNLSWNISISWIAWEGDGCGCNMEKAIAKANGVDVTLPLGQDNYGQPAGQLWLQGDNNDPMLAQPAGLQPQLAAGVTAVTNADGSIRQAKTSQLLADIVSNSPASFTVNYYHSDGFTGPDTNGLYQPTSNAYLSVAVSYPGGGDRSWLQVQQYGAAWTQRFDYGWTGSGWTLTNNGVICELRNKDWGSTTNVCTQTYAVKYPGGTPAMGKIEEYTVFPWGLTNLTQQIIGPNSDRPLTNKWTYCVDTNDLNYRQLTLVQGADGSWGRYAYDEWSRPIRKWTPFKDMTDAQTNDCRRTEFEYFDDGAGTRRTMETDYVGSTEVSRRFHVVSGAVTKDVVCTAPGVTDYAGANTLTTITTNNMGEYVSSAVYGEPLSILRPDGTVSIFEYTVVSNQTKTITEWRGAPSSGNPPVSDGTKTVTIFNLAGQQLSQQVWDRGYLDLPYASVTTTNLDELGRTKEADYLDGTYDYFNYDCCHLDNQTDREGIFTQHYYDDAGREVGTLRAGVTTSNVLDAAGRVIAMFRNGVRMGSSTFDTAGRQLAATNALSNVTTFAEGLVGGALVRTNVFPDGSTRIDASYRDGQPKSVTGTGVHGVRHVYDVEPVDGVQRLYDQEIKLLADGTESSEWTKTYFDMAGHPFKRIRADSNVVEEVHYNTLGQLEWQKDGDGVTTLYAYNARGERAITAVSMSKTNVINYSTDRIVSNVNEVLATDLGLTRRAATWVLTEDAPVCVEAHEVGVESLAERNIAFGLTNLITTALDRANARRTVTNTAPDGSFSVSVFENGRLISATRKDAAGGQLEGATLGYDAAGRLATNTDARLGAKVFVFDDADQTTSVSRGGQTELFAYDVMGRVSTNTLPDGAQTILTYWPTGETNLIRGGRNYPAAHGWDYAGRKASLTTWTNFALQSGAATTRWFYAEQTGFPGGKIYQDGTTNALSFTPGGRPWIRALARGISITNSFDASGLLTNTAYSDGITAPVAQVLDRRGRPISVSDGTGTRQLTYNDAGQVLTESFPVAGVTVTNFYDAILRRTNLTAAGFTQTFGYGAASRLKTVGFGQNTVTYDYVPNSALVAGLTFSNGLINALSVEKHYDALNRLTNITTFAVSPTSTSLSVANSFTYQYNTANQRTRNTFADGSYWEYGCDSLGQLTNAVRRWLNGDPVAGQQFSYADDDIGNWNIAVVNGRTANYTANSLNQYTSRTVPGSLDIIGSAHPEGTVTINGQVTTRHSAYYYKEITVDNTNSAVWQPVEVVGTLTNPPVAITNSGFLFLTKTAEQFTFDLDGNQTSDGRWTNTWNAENRLIAMETRADLPGDVPRLRLEFQYDLQGRRVRKQVFSWISGSWVLISDIRFIYDDWLLVSEQSASGGNLTTNSYVWGLDLSGSLQGAGGVGGLLAVTAETNGTHFAASDGNGNVVGLYKSNDAAVTAIFEYDPFGNILRATGPMVTEMPFRFSTKYQDDQTGLHYYPFRYYNGVCWLNRDPIGAQGGINLYSFTKNSPISYFDPFGLEIQWEDLPRQEILSIYRDWKEEHKDFPTPLTEIYIGRKAGFHVWYAGDCDCKDNIKGKVFLVQYRKEKGSWVVDYDPSIDKRPPKPWKEKCSHGDEVTRQPGYRHPNPGSSPGIRGRRGEESYIDSPTLQQTLLVEAWCWCPCQNDRKMTEKIYIHYKHKEGETKATEQEDPSSKNVPPANTVQ